jgi:hypothetical protein
MTVATARGVTVRFDTIGSGNTATLNTGGITATGSANVEFFQGTFFGFPDDTGGLGILGGGSDHSVDLGETLTINYNQLVTGVTMDVYDIDPPGNVTYSFQAFNGAASLGTFNVPLHVNRLETKNLTSLAGGQAFTRVQFSLSASAPFGLVFPATSFTPVPEPMVICSAPALLLCARRRPRN